MKHKKTSILKQAFLILTLLVFIGGIGVSSPVPTFAETDSQRVDQGIVDAFEREQMGEFKGGGKNYYYLDSVTERDAKKAREDSVWENIKDKLFGWTDFSGNFMDKFNTFLNMIVNMAFKMNLFMTNTMIMVLDFAFDIDIIGVLVNDLQKSIQDMTGISGGKFLGGGLFGGLVKMVVILAVICMLYVFVIRRAFLESIGALMKTIITLTLSLLLFSNYATFISGAQSITHDATRYIIGLTTWNEGNNISVDNNTKSTMKDSLWTMFVDRPYLYMQYGTHDTGQIGKSRIEDLLKTPTGEDRYEKVLTKEVAEHNNDFMVHSSVLDRLSFSAFYVVVNGIVSMPIFMLAILLIVLQFWFLIIAAIAPFALLIASIPGFFGVLKRYAIEFVIPLALKIFFAFFTVLLLILSEALFSMSVAQRFNAQSIVDYIAVGVFHFVLFITLFLLRKRISNVFASGSQVIAGLREASGPVNPFSIAKKGLQGTATVAGTAIGAFVGGPAGAAMGASIGSTAGRAMTGEAGVAEVASASARAANFSRLSKLGSTKGTSELAIQEKGALAGFMKEKGFGKDTIDETMEAFEKNGLYDVTSEEFEEQYDKMVQKSRTGEMNKDFSQSMISGIKGQREENRLNEQERILRRDQRPTETSESAARFFHEKGAHHATRDVVASLEKAGLQDVGMAEMEAQYSKMQSQFEKGQLQGNFADEFANGIKARRVQDANYEENERVFRKMGPEFGPNDFNDHKTTAEHAHVSPTPMENRDMELKSLYDEEQLMGGQAGISPMPNGSMDSKQMDVGEADVKPVQDTSMDGPRPSTANSQATTPAENAPIGDGPIQTATFDSKQPEVRPMEAAGRTNASHMDNSSLEGAKMNATGGDSGPIRGNVETGPINEHHMDGSSLNGTSMNASPMETKAATGSQMDDGRLGNSLSPNQLGAKPMGAVPLQGGSMDTTPLQNDSLSGGKMDKNPIGNNPVGGSQMETKPFRGNEMKGGSMDSTPFGDNPVGTNSIETNPLGSNPLGGSKMDASPLGGREMKGSAYESGPLQGKGMDVKPLEQSSFGGSSFEASTIESKPLESGRTKNEPVQPNTETNNAPTNTFSNESNRGTEPRIPRTERLNHERDADDAGDGNTNH